MIGVGGQAPSEFNPAIPPLQISENEVAPHVVQIRFAIDLPILNASSSEDGVGQICSKQLRSSKIGFTQIAIAQILIAQVLLAEIAAAKSGSLKIDRSQIDSLKTNSL